MIMKLDYDGGDGGMISGSDTMWKFNLERIKVRKVD